MFVQNTKFGAKIPFFREFRGKIEIFEHPYYLLSEICSCRKIANFCPSYFFTYR